MKKQAWFGVLVAAIVLFVAGVPAQAQDMGKFTVFAGYSYQLNNSGVAPIFSGFGEECIFIPGLCNGQQGLHGYTGSIVYNFNRHIGLEANFAGHNGTTKNFREAQTDFNDGFEEISRQDSYTYTFGPKLTLPVGNFALFSHFLVGGAHEHAGFTDHCIPANVTPDCGSDDAGSSRGNGFAFKIGGGADWNHGRWGIRILEVDYVHTSIFSALTEDGSSSTPLQTHTGGNNFELATGIKFNFGGMR